MKQKLLKTMLLLCALIVGSGNVWATDVNVLSENFSTNNTIDKLTSAGWTFDGNKSMQSGTLQMASNNGAGSATTPAFSSLVGTTATLTFDISSSSGGSVNTLTITGNSCKVDGGTSTTASTDAGSVTINITEASTASTITFSAAKKAACRIDNVVVYYTTGGGPTTYTVTYNGNGATSGSVPTDASSPYASGSTVTVLGNTGSLAKTGYSFGGWNTKANGTGTDYDADDTFTITANTILYAQWNFVVEDGVFDFVKAASAGEDYGSGVTTTSSSSEYITDDKTWTAGNVTMVTSKVSGNGYRWWSDGTLRFYNKSSATFSVPDGYVITKIVTTGANFDSASDGTLSSSTWTGASNEVTLYAENGRNVKTITVTYTTENQSVTVTDAGYATYCSPYALDFTGKGIKAYIATSSSASAVTLSAVNKVPANTGVLLKYTGGTTENIPVFDGTDADDVSENLLAVSNGSVTGGAGIYALANKSHGVGFYLVSDKLTIASGKVYLDLSGSPVKEFLDFDFGGDNETAIESLTPALSEDKGYVYDLSGRRVQKPTKGLYIVNGKKIMF